MEESGCLKASMSATNGFRNTLTQDPYSWKFPQRNETMYLSTIRKIEGLSRSRRGAGEGDVGNNVYEKSIKESSTLHTKGIEKSTPAIKFPVQFQKNYDNNR
jgi:hypothetical protein